LCIIGTRRELLDQRKILAWLLLLLLARVLIPEATLLRMHTHRHTEMEVAHLSAGQSKHHSFFTSQHQHCHSEQLYNAPFQLAPGSPLPTLLLQLSYACYRPERVPVQVLHLLDGASLRGPPVQG